MATRLKIDLSNGVLEVEGNEQLVKKMYNEWKDRFDLAKGSKSNRKKAKTSAKGPKVVEDLSLEPKNAISLKEVIQKFRPSNRNERFLAYIYFLSQNPEVKKVTPAHIHTCMVKSGEKALKSLPQSLYHVKRNTGWIDNQKNKGWIPTEKGKNQVEKRMKK